MSSVDKTIECPVCHGTPINHGAGSHEGCGGPQGVVYGIREGDAVDPLTVGGHDWVLDKYSINGPGYFRCKECNASAKAVDRGSMQGAFRGNVAWLMHKVIRNKLAKGELAVLPCDVCGGSGQVFLTAVDRPGASGLPSCPRCMMSDRVIPTLHTADPAPEELLLGLYGEVMILDPGDNRTSEQTHLCGRCRVLFVDKSVDSADRE